MELEPSQKENEKEGMVTTPRTEGQAKSRKLLNISIFFKFPASLDSLDAPLNSSDLTIG